MVKAGKIANPGLLSPRMTWMASKETDEFISRPETFIEEAGTSLKAAMEILRKYGTMPEALLPFHINTAMYTGNEKDFFATAASRRIYSYFSLAKNLSNWRNWLATKGPLMAVMTADATWDNATSPKGRLDTFSPTQPEEAMRYASLATQQTNALLYATVGAQPGEIRDLLTPVKAISMQDSSMKAMVLPFKTSDASCQRPFPTGGALAFLLIINLFLFPVNALYADNTISQTRGVMAMIQLVEKDNGRIINIHRGDSFQITLAENATTGYRWAIEYYDKSVIDKISSDAQYLSEHSDPAALWTFRSMPRALAGGRFA